MTSSVEGRAAGIVQVLNFVIHVLRKEQHQDPQLTLRQACVPLDELVTVFTTKAASMFAAQKAGQVYASFNPDEGNYPFQGYLRRYIDNGQTEAEFLDFSHRSAKLLEARMKSASGSTGGFLIFAHYCDDDLHNVLVLLLNHKGTYTINEESLTLNNSIHLDMEKIDIATRIDINTMYGGGPDPVSIVGGKKRISEYFQEFVGADQRRTAKQTTRELGVVVDNWMEEHGYTPEAKAQIQASLLEYYKTQKSNQEPVDLKTVAAIVAPSEADEFFRHANVDHKISSEFTVDPTAVSHWVTVEYKSQDLTLRFSRKLADDHTIQYDPQENVLTIHDVPEELGEKILKLTNPGENNGLSTGPTDT